MSILVRRFGLRGPMIVAPLGGGPTTPELVGVSCEHGALGCLAGAYLSPHNIISNSKKVRELTSRPFAVNLFGPLPTQPASAHHIATALNITRPYRSELGIGDTVLSQPYHEDFDAQFAAVMEVQPEVFSFVFGVLDGRYLQECHKRGIFVIGTATKFEEGAVLEELGVDAVVAQGVEAGGHRAMFSSTDADSAIPTIQLTQQLSKALRIPVIASGGIMTGEAMANAMRSGAQAVQLGTAFLLAKEAGTNAAYRRALIAARDAASTDTTRTTRAFSGRLARGVVNRFMTEMDAKPEAILPFPAGNAFTRDIRAAAAAQGKHDFLSLWAGQGLKDIKEGSAATIIRDLLTSYEDHMAQ